MYHCGAYLHPTGCPIHEVSGAAQQPQLRDGQLEQDSISQLQLSVFRAGDHQLFSSYLLNLSPSTPGSTQLTRAHHDLSPLSSSIHSRHAIIQPWMSLPQSFLILYSSLLQLVNTGKLIRGQIPQITTAQPSKQLV
ncbi:hypothetical protein SLA2020_227750 [Shorea laevis]